ncbi:DUF6011 domain-containing protein [Brevibacterium sp. R8603A2]|uniref:DUF6011 domain-containing protein n=1 Tax=Brevibacterium sp. R8603A2 TaxID=2929779 RepID=UPI001FF85B7B|nr:DUF6011 domain-containing protein [Brevibacterium sp. R8603A2]MCK1801783.1 DUF6011 domain-containing protein [Brevibacterium sp. R8603A2]
MIPTEASPKLTERLTAELRERAEALGLVIATRCRFCGTPLWHRRSVAMHAGPVCRKRHETENDPGLTPAKKSQTEAAPINPNH